MFKKVITLLVLIMVAFVYAAPEAYAKKRGKSKGGLSAQQIEQITSDIKHLTKKVYSASLFSPDENETLIAIKIDLDSGMILGSSPEYAPLYYMAGNLYRDREYNREAIECYQAILENFQDTAFAPKARKQLQVMGVKIEISDEDSEEDEE